MFRADHDYEVIIVAVAYSESKQSMESGPVTSLRMGTRTHHLPVLAVIGVLYCDCLSMWDPLLGPIRQRIVPALVPTQPLKSKQGTRSYKSKGAIVKLSSPVRS